MHLEDADDGNGFCVFGMSLLTILPFFLLTIKCHPSRGSSTGPSPLGEVFFCFMGGFVIRTAFFIDGFNVVS